MTGIMIASIAGWITPEQAPEAEAVNVFLDNLDGVVAAVWGTGNLVLRGVTTGPVGTRR